MVGQPLLLLFVQKYCRSCGNTAVRAENVAIRERAYYNIMRLSVRFYIFIATLEGYRDGLYHSFTS